MPGVMPVGITISIHALREERDLIIQDDITPDEPISIHALREERDSFLSL